MNDRTGGDSKQNRQRYFLPFSPFRCTEQKNSFSPIQVIRSFSDRIFTGFG